jgi:predicted HD phosphohydrolase
LPNVAVKLYSCGTEPDHVAKPPKDSMLGLSLQSGLMLAEEGTEFAALPGAQDAVRLRRFDEQAKVKRLRMPPVEHTCPVPHAA